MKLFRTLRQGICVAGLVFVLLTLCAGSARAQYLTWCNTSDLVYPLYTVSLEDASKSGLSGYYYAIIYLDGVPFDSAGFTIYDDLSISPITQGYLGTILWFGAPTDSALHSIPGTHVLTCDGNLYDINGNVAGSVSMDQTLFTFALKDCSCGGPGCPIVNAYFPSVSLAVSPKSCSACAGDCAPGASTFGLNSLHVDFSLGRGTNFQGAISLTLNAETALTNLASPKSLIPVINGKARVKTDANGLRQLLSGQVLADVVINNNFQYDIRFYRATDAGTTNGSGLYQPTNSPFKVMTIQNPDATAGFNRLWVTTVEGSVTSQFQYSYDTNSTTYSNTWRLAYPSNLRKEVLTTTWNSNRTERTTLLSVYNPGSPDALAYQEQNKYVDYGWGAVHVEQIVDPSGARLTNSWQYYTNKLQGGNHNNEPNTRLKQVVRWDGYWEKYEYDNERRETNRLSGFLNATNGSSPGSCRVTTTSYSGTAPQITRIDYLLGQEIGRSYQAHALKTVSNFQCQIAGASWTNPANLLTVKKLDYTWRLFEVWHPDGTRSIYSYVTNADKSVRTTMTSGQVSGTNVVEGIKTITVVGPFGQMISNIVVHIAGGVDGAILERDSYSYAVDDYAFRSPTVNHLDDTQTSGSQGCCGSPNLGNAVDKDGTTTYFKFDALLRTTSSTIDGITFSNLFDSLGNVAAMIRTGTDGSPITNQLAVYDLAARLVSETDALNHTTVYTNYFDSEGRPVRKAMFADGGTRVETQFRDGQLDRVTGTAVFPVRYEYGVAPDNGVYRAYRAQIKLDAAGADTAECVTNFLDMLGRTYKTVYSGASNAPFAISYFNNRGQLTNDVDPDGVSVLYLYNGKGERTYTVLDVNTNAAVDFSGIDRITFTTNDAVVNNGTNVRRTRTYVWPNNGLNVSNLVSTIETSADGLRQWTTIWNSGTAITSQSRTVYDAANGYRYVTNIAPDNSYSLSVFRYGTNVSFAAFDATGAQIERTTFGYDAHGRQNTVTDARTGTATFTFNPADQVSSTRTPAPVQVTTNYFDNLGRVWKRTLADGASVTNEYYPTGLLKRTFGARTYPVAYNYDAQGRLKTMINWSTFASGAGERVTTWNYDGYRGFLTNKVYDGSNAGPSFTYTAAGRLKSQSSARGITTGYTYNNSGDPSATFYSDGSAGITNGYDRLGRRASITNGPGICFYRYNDAGLLTSDTYSGGPLNGLSVTNRYDSILRRTTNELWSGTARLTQTRYTYDAASRLRSVGSGANSATYTYLADSPLISQVAHTNGSTLRLATTRTYDNLDRLNDIQSVAVVTPVAAFSYGYNSANQRTTMTTADNAHWTYTYDPLGQVTSGSKYWNDGMPVAGQQFQYGFDEIGNRKFTAAGGDQYGADLRYAFYTPNTLNEYSQRSVPGYVDVLGEAIDAATVTVNNTPVHRKGSYFRGELPADNSASAQWLSLTNLAVLSTGTNIDMISASVGNIFVAQTPEAFAYDADGNLTNSGRWSMTWDAENRAASFTRISSAPAGSKVKVDCQYDYLWRRTQKIVSAWNGSYVAQATNRFVYDGWNLTAVLNETNGLLYSFTWGADLSGTLQGAGGVGGLIAMTVHQGTNAGTYFYCYDGSGNVMSLVNATDGTMAAQYEYGAFGELLRATGPLASANPFLFSTKFYDVETGLSYYGYRYYDSSTGRWLSRDPDEEQGGLNLTAFAYNDAVNAIDDSGLGVIYVGDENGSGAVTYTPPPPVAPGFRGFVSKLKLGSGNAKKKVQACESKCEELKALMMKAYVADDVYVTRDGLEHVPGAPNYERLSAKQVQSLGLDPNALIDDDSGFYSAIYRDRITGNYLVAFRGTEPKTARDDLNDLQQNFGKPSAQYQAAAKLGGLLNTAQFRGKISGVGHSLGGGLDTIAALIGKFQAVNFNPAGINRATAKRLNIDLNVSEKLVTSYSVPGDIVSRGVNRTFLAPDTNGKQILLPSPGSLPLGLNRHGTENIIHSIQRLLSENGCN